MYTKKLALLLVVLLTISYSFSQENFYSFLTLDASLKDNANAVVRLNDITINVEAPDKMITSVKRIVTVLNKQGDDDVNSFVHYDNNIKIKSLEAVIFNALGKQLKKFKKNDFNDVSAVSGGTLYSDSRVKYLEYTPVNYPYTIELTYDVMTNSTAFIIPFRPLEGFYVSTENSSFTIEYAQDLNVRKKEKNLEGIDVVKEELSNKISYNVNNVYAVKPEKHSPSFSSLRPETLFSLDNFSLEGVSASVDNWNDFGKWMYKDLIKDAYDLPENTINAINDLVKDAPNDLEKAKRVYQYVQDKTRYISVQVGIGGWKPFNASQVDDLGYGDCKALTNYTMSLLKAVGVESYYSVVSAGNSQQNIEKDFASMQGNHVILSLPIENETIWLECTSQKMPFGFLGDFTDDRDVLVVKPDGGEIQHTKKYTTEESTQIIKGKYTINSEGNIGVSLNMTSKGIQYDSKYHLADMDNRGIDKHYKNYWKYINNINNLKVSFNNDKQVVQFDEVISFNAEKYATLVGDRMLVTLNALNRNAYVPDRYKNRKLPLKIYRGYKDIDEIEIKLPEGYILEAISEDQSVITKFGEYKIVIKQKDDTTLLYKRELTIKDGEFDKEDYESYREFRKLINKYDNLKVIMLKT